MHKLSGLKPITRWLSDEELETIYTAEYWNNIEEEKKKEWWIEGTDYCKLWDYLKSTKLYDDYLAAEKKLKDISSDNLIVADLAAGIGWTSALLSRLENVLNVKAVEISKHRIHSLFESAIDMFEGNPKKINRFIGSFYDTRFDDNSIDIVFMCQAFHHADRPFHLLHEISRILKPSGKVLIIGEHYIDTKRILKRFLKTLVKQRKIITYYHELFRPDLLLGDHYYRVSDYYFLAESLGFSCSLERLPSGDAMYILNLE